MMFLILALLSIHSAQSAEETTLSQEHIIWKNIPLDVSLSVQDERVMAFSQDVQPWLPEGYESLLNVEALGSYLYLTAKQPFERLRIKVRSVDQSRYYVIYLTALESATLPKLVKITHQEDLTQEVKNHSVVATNLDWNLRLIRFAAQQLYAPKAVRVNDPAIVPVSVNTQFHNGSDLQSVIRGGKVKSTVIARWRALSSTPRYVTAYRLENLSEDWVRLSHPQHLRGAFISSSFQHSELAPRQQAIQQQDQSHVTVLYVTSQQPVRMRVRREANRQEVPNGD